MAITSLDLNLWRILRKWVGLPERPRVVEIGEANLYGDVDPSDIPELEGADFPGGKLREWDAYRLAKVFYKRTLDYSEIVSLDLFGGTDRAIRWDLNEPPQQDWLGRFDVLINTGTIEHVFNQYQVWKTCHDLVAPNGIMVHNGPVKGWFDHGFYTLNPTLLKDLAKANKYETISVLFAVRDENDRFHPVTNPKNVAGDVLGSWAWKKVKDEPFKVPQQGMYAEGR